MNPIPPREHAIRALWRRAQAVCFDVDSTVSPDEGIDVLAAFAGVGAQVSALTASAMGGSLLFQDALRQRLDLIRPSRQMLSECLIRHPPRLTPGIAALISALIARKKNVYLLSGGFTQMIAPLLKQLALPDDHLIANSLCFDDAGNYAGFAVDAPTSRSGGKAVAIRALQMTHAYRPLIMVGDGVTDLEARPPADGFIGYGGVIVRDKVKQNADWFVADFAELLAALDSNNDK